MEDDTVRRLDNLIREFTLKLEGSISTSGAKDPVLVANVCASIESLANARVALAGPWVESEETPK